MMHSNTLFNGVGHKRTSILSQLEPGLEEIWPGSMSCTLAYDTAVKTFALNESFRKSHISGSE